MTEARCPNCGAEGTRWGVLNPLYECHTDNAECRVTVFYAGKRVGDQE